MAHHVFGHGYITWIGNLETGKYPNGNPSNRILFRIVSNREYSQQVTKQDGTTQKEYVPDYMFCEARDGAAVTLANHATARDASGKLISRQIFYVGTAENFKKPKTFNGTITDEHGNQTQTPITVSDYEQHVFKITDVQFLSAKPEEAKAMAVNGGTGVTVSASQNSVKSGQQNQNAGFAGNQQGSAPVQPNNGFMNPPAQQPQPQQTYQPQVQPQNYQPQAQGYQPQPQQNPVPQAQQNGGTYSGSMPHVPEGYTGDGTPF